MIKQLSRIDNNLSVLNRVTIAESNQKFRKDMSTLFIAEGKLFIFLFKKGFRVHDRVLNSIMDPLKTKMTF